MPFKETSIAHYSDYSGSAKCPIWMPNHLISELQKVWYWNVSGIQMVSIQIPTVVCCSDPHCRNKTKNFQFEIWSFQNQNHWKLNVFEGQLLNGGPIKNQSFGHHLELHHSKSGLLSLALECIGQNGSLLSKFIIKTEMPFFWMSFHKCPFIDHSKSRHVRWVEPLCILFIESN